MAHQQRYVSDELTHFVGRGKPESDQAALLVRILKEGRLTSTPNDPHGDAVMVKAHPGRKLCDHELLYPNVVCFCDIPGDDLPLHMAKYSRFGLSFKKDFLVEKGANPVWYIAKDSIWRNQPREESINVWMDAFSALPDLWRELFEKDFDYTPNGSIGPVQQNRCNDWIPEDRREGLLSAFYNMQHVYWYALLNVLPHLKCFDSSLEESHLDNYYMEREWRVHGEVRFTMADVERLLFPRRYAETIRLLVPDYCGQTTFSD